jgi:hypothetical protein
VITVEATDAVATEGGDTATFTFSRTGLATAALTVCFSTGGTATLSTDYSLPSPVTSVSFAAGQSTATKTVTALNDALIDPDETVIGTLTTCGPYAIGSPSAATVTIVDTTPVITVEATEAAVPEVALDGAMSPTITRVGDLRLTRRELRTRPLGPSMSFRSHDGGLQAHSTNVATWHASVAPAINDCRGTC